MHFQFHQLVVIFLLSAMKSSLTIKVKQNCTQPQSCGPLSIPYPFGTKTSGCYFDETFLITCDQAYNPPKPYLPKTNITVLNISIDGELTIEGPIAQGCFNKLGNRTDDSTIEMAMNTSSNFPISSKRNKFTAVGCDTLGVIGGYRGRNHTTGCLSLCSAIQDVINGSCSGTGCCQMPIPNEIWDYGIAVGSVFNHTKSSIYDTSSCDYAFVVDDSYNFSSLDLKNLQNRKSFPLVLDWSIVNKTCEQAQEFKDNYACQARYSECVDSSNGIGYRCNCSQGFEGNPYLPGGCIDINECNTLKPCHMTCDNIPGSYRCSCPFGYRGDGRKNKTGCSPIITVILGIGLGFLVLLVGGSWIYIGLKKRKLIKLKEKFFEQNGGLLLQRQLSDYEGSVETAAKIFSLEDLKRATNNFEKSRVLGEGGHGTVYKGMLTDNKIVAIKKSKIVDLSQIEEFINEVVLLSQINHRNVVKLLGCCLETEVPLLVYEFISNGTVYDHIHNNSTNISWKMRLKIATEIAGALAYLHSSTCMPIIHRDVKTTNILLDQSYTTKVSDFGASRLVPLDKTQLTTLVQGTFGYLDPEYFHTSQLTEKSDVYSFGVVLAELLTSEKALSFERPECIRNLATYFVSSMKEESLLSILDNKLVSEEKNIEDIVTVANLTKSCLRVRREDRPTMKEVAMELERLINKNGKHTWREDEDQFLEETEYLLKPSKYHVGKDHEVLENNCSHSTSKFDSMENQMLIIHGGR